MNWVSTYRVPPPAYKTISVRHGNSVCFAYYSPLLDSWKMLANGTEEELARPSLWLCKDPNIQPEPVEKIGREPNFMRRSKRPQQLQLL